MTEKRPIFVSVTRLRIRSLRFLPFFVWHTLHSISQVKKSAGFLEGALLPDQNWTFWTLTSWESEASMRQYMVAGSHRSAMPHLLNWCDEASVVHWDDPEGRLPTWQEADSRMRAQGRTSKVRFPSPTHATLSYASPRVTASQPIRRAKGRMD